MSVTGHDAKTPSCCGNRAGLSLCDKLSGWLAGWHLGYTTRSEAVWGMLMLLLH